jgi:hypothetical protein
MARHGEAAQVGEASDLLGHPVSTEHEAGDGDRHEPSGVLVAPLVEVPVVVGAGHGGDELVVVVLHEELTADARP